MAQFVAPGAASRMRSLFRHLGGLLLVAAAGSAGCAESRTGWISLFDGRDMRSWKVLRGSAAGENGALVLDGRQKNATILAKGVGLKNGTVEVRALRRGPQPNAGPFTVALRLQLRVTWRSVYFVCRPESVETCRASWRKQMPSPEGRASIEPTDRAELWRFVMNEGAVQCFRDGREVISCADPAPSAGSVAITAARCRVEILSVRYRRGVPPGNEAEQSP